MTRLLSSHDASGRHYRSSSSRKQLGGLSFPIKRPKMRQASVKMICEYIAHRVAAKIRWFH
jgi:hypothetical protein